MQKVVIGAWEARRTLGKILSGVGYQGDAVVVKKNGQPLVAIVPVQFLDKWEEQRKAFFDDMRRVSQRSKITQDEAIDLANQAVLAVRAERQRGQLSPL